MTETCNSHLVLETLPREEVVWVEENLRRLVLPAGHCISRAGTKIAQILFPFTGAIGHWAENADGRRVEVIVCGPQSIVGSTALVGDGRASCTTIVRRELKGIALPAALFSLLSARAPSLAHQIGLAAMDENFRLADAVVRQAFSPAIARLAHKLQSYFEVEEINSIQATHDELAEALGLRRATISLTLQELEAEKAVRVGRRNIELVNAEKLANLAVRKAGSVG